MIISTCFITAYAYGPIYATFERIASIATGNTDCSAAEGISVAATGDKKRLFVVKVNPDTDENAVLFMYKDYTDMSDGGNTGKYGKFILSGFAGHANGMAIDDEYIYITCWKDDANNTNGHKIARIKRSVLWSMYQSNPNDVNKGTLTATSNGVTILPVEYSDGTAYDREKVASITYYKNGQFIIGYPQDIDTQAKVNANKYFTGTNVDITENNYLSYTTAQVSGSKFVVNNSKSDVFHVACERNSAKAQDIGYHENCGFFIVRWIGGAQNDIIWLRLNSLSGENRVYDGNNSKYRIIKVNADENIYSKFELESVSIGSNKCMYASVNTEKKSSYNNPNDNTNHAVDAIVTIERPTAVGGSYNFLGSYFTQG